MLLIPRLEAAADATADAAEPAIQPVDAIIVTGDTAIDGPATSAIPAPAAETATDDETTGGASFVLPNKTGSVKPPLPS